MIKQLTFDDKYRRAYEHVFGKTLLCKDIDTATNYSNSDNLDCITLDGMLKVYVDFYMNRRIVCFLILYLATMSIYKTVFHGMPLKII